MLTIIRSPSNPRRLKCDWIKHRNRCSSCHIYDHPTHTVGRSIAENCLQRCCTYLSALGEWAFIQAHTYLHTLTKTHIHTFYIKQGDSALLDKSNFNIRLYSQICIRSFDAPSKYSDPLCEGKCHTDELHKLRESAHCIYIFICVNSNGDSCMGEAEKPTPNVNLFINSFNKLTYTHIRLYIYCVVTSHPKAYTNQYKICYMYSLDSDGTEKILDYNLSRRHSELFIIQ